MKRSSDVSADQNPSNKRHFLQARLRSELMGSLRWESAFIVLSSSHFYVKLKVLCNGFIWPGRKFQTRPARAYLEMIFLCPCSKSKRATGSRTDSMSPGTSYFIYFPGRSPAGSDCATGSGGRKSVGDPQMHGLTNTILFHLN